MTDREEYTVTIRNEDDWSSAIDYVSKICPSRENPYTITVTQGDVARSLKQNRLSFLWYKMRGNATGHGMIHERCHCKLHYGCPILVIEDDKFARFYTTAILPLPYEDQIDAMEYVPVTRLMSMRQFAEYLRTVDEQSASKGIVLPRPEDLYWDALMEDRRS